MNRRDDTYYTCISVVARQAGLSSQTVRRYVRRGLVEGAFSEVELAQLRRIRRLTGLGINLAGVEVILRMRQHIEGLQAEVRDLRRILDELT